MTAVPIGAAGRIPTRTCGARARQIRRCAGDHGAVEDERKHTFTRPEDLLAHYTTAAVAFEHVLPERRLRMSPYRVMRDPAENKDIVPGTAFSGDQPDAEEGWAATVDGIKRIRDGCRVLSLTRDAADQGVHGSCWARPRMWEQYADVHRGACLVFDREELHGTLHAELNQLGPHYVDEVRYTAAGIAESATRNIIDERIFDPQQRPMAVAEYIESNHGDFFFLKGNDFATEREYRAVLMHDADEHAYISFRDALVAVIVGERFPDWQVPGAAEVCEEAGVKLRRMHWENGRPFALDALAVKRLHDRRRREARESGR
jgi:hypothetical protein